ncbi:MAG: pyruvate dehydrogenase complex E1 component subunit beta [Pseudomonadaceae bacterium]|nr:pyruvate dehydrogenase complex E1 component subunit beta [Pseudomonadaceae bacterium]
MPVPNQTYRDAIRDAMSEEMRRDANVLLMGEEVADYQGSYKCSVGMVQEFGHERVIDTPIAECGFTGIAVGAAMAGLKPIVEYMTWNFAMLATDHIINSAAKTHYMSGGKVSCPIVFRGLNGVAAHVAAQHSQDYASWYMNIPGLKVVAPSDPADAKGLLKAAIRDTAPVVVLEHEVLYGHTGEVPEGDDYTLEIGKARVDAFGDGEPQVSVFAYSMMAVKAREAAKQLASQGIACEVVDLRSLRPLDKDAIAASVARTHRAVVLEETWAPAGVGAEVMATISDTCWDELDAPVVRMSQADVPLPYAPNLEVLCVPQVEDIVRETVALVGGER